MKSKFVYSSTEIKKKINDAISNNYTITIFGINLNTLYLCNRDPHFSSEYTKADAILFDGFAAIFWAKMMGFNKKIELLGADHFMKILFPWCEINDWSVYVLGGSENTTATFGKNILDHFSKLRIVGHQHGYFPISENHLIVDRINNLKPRILIVGLGAPYENYWINTNRAKINSNIIVTCGGYIEQTSQKGINYYPYPFLTKYHLNWLYRIFKEPKRLYKRYLKQILWLSYWLPKEILKKYFNEYILLEKSKEEN
jgi:N-acetylglucosaminyldiphosphoundecaprenol N-acetyl-beta-D-mannosaminyltransferase